MIQSVKNYPVSQIFDINVNNIFIVPKYQREYTWSTYQWNDLFNDVIDNDKGYFLGTIIAINKTKTYHESVLLEIVDGQQRLTTISLLLAAAYSLMNDIKKEMQKNDIEISEEQLVELVNLKNQLVIKGLDEQTRIVPQIQRHNFDDYRAKFSEIGLIKEKIDVPKYAGNRRIYLAYKFFKDNLESSINGTHDKLATLSDIVSKINSAVIVEILVSSHSDAYTLFESLNMRGTPLTAIDLIKNSLLAKSDSVSGDNAIEKSFDKWTRLLEYLGDDYGTQERFLRHYYNAFREELNKPFKQSLGHIATRSNIIKIYENLIDNNYKLFLDDILEAGKIYSILINNNNDSSLPYQQELLNLDRIQGSPSYLLLLYMIKNKNILEISNEDIRKTIELLIKFFVRRNLTDTPSTRDLTKIFMDIVSQISSRRNKKIFEHIKSVIVNISPSDDLFIDKLKGPIYEINTRTTRFILCYIAESNMNNEQFTDLWKTENNHYIWTIEHIFPQGYNIPKSWVKMIADGNEELAKEYQNQFVHTLGNLTISGYNSSLGNKDFIEKRDRIDKTTKKYIGYRNGLSLNEELAQLDMWTVDKIKERSKKLTNLTISLLKYE